MKKIMLLFTIILVFSYLPAYAIESTAYTYTLATDDRHIRTQDAYIPGSVMLREVELKSPEDLYVIGKTMYIADTGNARIVRFEMDTGRVDFLGVGILKQPTGVCVGKDGRIFVADYQAKAIVILDPCGDAISQTIGRPDALLYGASTTYKPQKVGVDAFGNLYVTSEGTHEGILQFDTNGNFAGFFGANTADSLTITEWIQETFYTAEQKRKLILRNPPRIVNLDVPQNNLVYSVTQFKPREALKKLNMAGINILRQKRFAGEDNFVDVTVSTGGEMFAVTSTGAITEYDAEGRYLFAFGGRAASADRNGLTSVVSAIAVDQDYNLFVLDKQRGVVQPYIPTDFALNIHQGLAHYSSGRYAEAADIWQEFVRLTPRSAFAHWGLGLALWQMGKYREAQYHLELVRDLEYASDAFWELRNEWLMSHLAQILVWLAALWIALWILEGMHRKYGILRPLTEYWGRLKKQYRLLSDLAYMKYMLRHPIDALYDLKHGKQGSVLSASLLYLLALGVWLADKVLTANLFNTMAFAYTWKNPLVITSMAVIPVALFIVGNYLISSIYDGEGTFKNVYVSTAYAFSCYIMATPFVTLLSHVLTLNEGFVHGLLKLAIGVYTLVLIFVATKETHDYSLGDTVKILLLTLCFMVLTVLAMMILYMTWNELTGFIVALIEEVRYRV